MKKTKNFNYNKRILTIKPIIEITVQRFWGKKREMKRCQRCVSNGTLSIA
jgi:hypothetical protein